MQIQVNTDNTIKGREDVVSYVEGVVNSKLGAVADHLTRVEVHIADENAHKGGLDKRCTVEARPRGRDPLAAHHTGNTIQNAVIGAVDKIRNVLDSELGKLKRHR
jgi:ribosome-associated translation inhibitor RaiA